MGKGERKRARDKAIQEIEEKRARNKAIQEIEQERARDKARQEIEEKACLLWKAAGKPKEEEDKYRELAIAQIKDENIPIYNIYYFVEKLFLEPLDERIGRQAFFTILGRIGNLAIVVAVVAFIFGEEVRRNNEVFSAWTTITTAEGQTGSGGRIEALQFLNSRPWRFPWIGWTEPGWYWDEQEEECKLKRLIGRRWERQPLTGLSAPKGAYLRGIYLCGADLGKANLQQADLGKANLQQADLWSANLQEARLVQANLQQARLWLANLQQARLWLANLEKADLVLANLQQADLVWANLQQARLGKANLQQAYLEGAENLTPQQIKSACFWSEAIYKGKWNQEKKAWKPVEPDNTNYIEELKKDKASDPKEPVDCSSWE